MGLDTFWAMHALGVKWRMDFMPFIWVGLQKPVYNFFEPEWNSAFSSFWLSCIS